ncbi:hypothetical protein BRADI_2g02087v3 [Brachypodium distachyon]|uniref:Uncharacterized protein n=1 Tax=Brachypodium distachyon TaxID=15368 RepID=A0A2K2D6H6_BRADI|nr:hypothetical protein BRADI_2g02087v3 [Brachypodium distachyon]
MDGWVLVSGGGGGLLNVPGFRFRTGGESFWDLALFYRGVRELPNKSVLDSPFFSRINNSRIQLIYSCSGLNCPITNKL